MKYLRLFLPVNPLTRYACLALGVATLAVPSHADIRLWDGDTSVTWATAGNWDTAPVNNLTTDIARFNLATYGGNPVFAPNAGTTSIAGIEIGASNGAMTLTTTNLSIGASGIIVEAGAAAATIGRITAEVDQTWTNNSSNATTLSGANVYTGRVTLAGSGQFIFALNVHTGAGGVTIDGASVTNSNTTTQFGTGLLELKSGSLTVLAGRTFSNDLSITGNFSFSAASTGPTFNSATKSTTGNVVLSFQPNIAATANTGVGFTVGSLVLGGNLEILALPGGNNSVRLVNRNFTSGLSMGGGNRTLTLSESAGSGTTTIGLLTLDGNLTIAGSGSSTTTLNGGFNTAGVNRTITFDKAGTGVATLSGAITGTASTLTIAGSSTSSRIGALTGATAHALEVNSTTGGSFLFNGASTFTGGVTVTSGTAVLGVAGVAATSGGFGTGALAITGGEVRATIGDALLGSSSITLNGGTLRGFNAATINYGGGAINVTANSTIVNERSTAGASTNMTFGTSLSVGNATLNVTSTDTFNAASTATITVGPGTLTGNGILNVTDNPAATNNTILALTTLTATGTGNQIANTNGVVSVSGLTTIGGASAGTLLVNGALTATGGVTVAANGTFGGSGTVTGAVTTTNTGSVITPGTSGIALLNVTGALNISSGATFKFDLSANSGASDRIAATGAFTGSGAGAMLLDFSSIGSLAGGTYTYTVLSYGSQTGLDRGDISVNTLPSGFTLDNTFGTTGFLIGTNDLQVQFTVVPEPSTYALMAVGLGMAAIWVRRRGRKNAMLA